MTVGRLLKFNFIEPDDDSEFAWYVSIAVQCMIFGLFSGAILYEQLQSVMRDETAIEYLIRMKRNRLRRKRTTSTGIGFRKNTTVLQDVTDEEDNSTEQHVPQRLSSNIIEQHDEKPNNIAEIELEVDIENANKIWSETPTTSTS